VTLWTIGHSTRTLDELVAALRAHGIELLVDVRAVPASKRHPHFNREHLEKELPRAGIDYRWLGDRLGGYRKQARADSPHIALRSGSFRRYADYMDTPPFREGIDTLLQLAAKHRTTYMCAEKLWWNCHRSIISDYLAAARAVDVVHIFDAEKTGRHRVSSAARLADGRLIYDVGETGRLL